MDHPPDWQAEEPERKIRIRVGVKAVTIAVLATGVIMGVVILLLIGLVDNLFSGMCGNDIISEQNQPDGKYKLVVFRRDCGATTGFSYQLSILKGNAELENHGGNIFVSDEEFHASWENSNTILINSSVDKFKRKTSYKGIHIRYSN